MSAVPLAIAVGISTYRRNEGLRDLLAGIERQRLGSLPDGAVSIIVADNSPDGGARQTCEAHRGSSRFGLRYVHASQKGLCFARNATLDAAIASAATHLGFIDDDEVPDPAWLARLFERLAPTGAAAAIGPVRPIFGGPAPAWAVRGGYFAKTLEPRGGALLDGYTSNALVDLAPVVRLGLRFDPRFDQTGGEDTIFFKRLRDAGEHLVWAGGAVVHEHIPPHRATRSWLWRRWFRTGGTESHLGRFAASSLLGRLHNASRGLARVVGGLGRLAVALPRMGRHPRGPMDATYTICRGAGLIAFACGRSYAEYAVPTYRWTAGGSGLRVAHDGRSTPHRAGS